ncbi:hypothetical protein JTE90_006188 [Oedothorax gibbosus]|uniref:ETS domain-containing protein n=1 Tax=Oedothorax gibbosus TaxID=931172 RepID=A0AAV6VV26_9ARAC|nr:hypothetical protein JTE90_006188 [Oedothorax gibbosus]
MDKKHFSTHKFPNSLILSPNTNYPPPSNHNSPKWTRGVANHVLAGKLTVQGEGKKGMNPWMPDGSLLERQIDYNMKSDHPTGLCNPDCFLHRSCSLYPQPSTGNHLMNRPTFDDPCLKLSPSNHQHLHHQRPIKHYYYGSTCDWRPIEAHCENGAGSKQEFYTEASTQHIDNTWSWNQSTNSITTAHSGVNYVGSFGSTSPSLESSRPIPPPTPFYLKGNISAMRTTGPPTAIHHNDDPRQTISEGVKPEPPSSPLSPGSPQAPWPPAQSRRGNLQLWQFLVSLLDDPATNGNFISWTGRGMEFKLIEPEEVARRWGIQKNRPAMNYDKLSRSLRYYYEKGIMQKVAGERYVYRFVSDPETLLSANIKELQSEKVDPVIADFNPRHTQINRKIYNSSDTNILSSPTNYSSRITRNPDHHGYQPLSCLQDLTSRPTSRDSRYVHNTMDNCVF